MVIQQDVTEITFTAASRYALPADVTVSGHCDHTYDPATGKLTISNVTGDVAVSARGAEIYHDIHLDPASGTVDPSRVTITESQTMIGTLPTPKRTGYTFTGWFTRSGDRVTVATANHLTGDLYLSARWSADTNIKYTVQQWVELVDSGVNPGYTQVDTQAARIEYQGKARTYYLYDTTVYSDGVSDGHKDISPYALAALEGMDLRGLTASGANAYSVTMDPDGSSVFPLYYDRNPYVITFDPNGGTIAEGDARADISYGSLYGTLPGAARSGYTLAGWFTEAQGGAEVKATDAYLLPADQTLYAHWATSGDTKYTVTHMVQALEDNIVSYDKVPGAYTKYRTDELYGDADATVDVYALAIPGFVPSPENVYSAYIKADGTGGVILYYDRQTVTVGYDANGGTLAAPGVKTLLYYGGTVSSLAAAPTRSGYTFDGWFLGTAETAQRVAVGMALAEINPDNLQAISLYAHWTKEEYHGGGGGGGGGNSRPTPTPKPVPVPVPTPAQAHVAYIKGYTDGTVRPEGEILRCEVAAIFYRLLDDQTRARYATGTPAFPDVPEGAWYADAVAALASMAVIEGCADGTFQPERTMTRAEFAAVAARFQGKATVTPLTFSDISGHWAEEYIGWASGFGWMVGDGSGAFRPDDTMTRAEVVTAVNRIFDRRVDAGGLLEGMKTFPDNADTSSWYYCDIQEAANGHSFSRKENGFERWKETRV